jgi:hypothetical protein
VLIYPLSIFQAHPNRNFPPCRRQALFLGKTLDKSQDFLLFSAYGGDTRHMSGSVGAASLMSKMRFPLTGTFPNKKALPAISGAGLSWIE